MIVHLNIQKSETEADVGPSVAVSGSLHFTKMFGKGGAIPEVPITSSCYCVAQLPELFA